jgi:gliding motility-associated-like protein
MLCMASGAWADHLVGGEIYYECLGGDQYRITLKVYRDCYTVTGAPFDSPAFIAVYNAGGGLVANLSAPFTGSQQLAVTVNDPCLQAPPDVCVEEAIYTADVNLPFSPGGYHVAYQRCCRNGSIVNLVSPADQGSTYYVEIPEMALNSCNSGPRYDQFPPLALCTGEPMEFDHSATDPDGDMLVYSLCTPYHGGSSANPAPVPAFAPPYSTIVWNPGYSASYPIDASTAFQIDPTTGLLTGVPDQVGRYVVGVCVEEYRNGSLISRNVRDFQFNVVSCGSFVAAVIPPQPLFHDPCDGLEVNFGNNSVNALTYLWDFGVEGITDDISDLEGPIYTYPDTGTYSVTLIANPGYPCADTTLRDVVVHNDVSVEIQSTGELCFDVNSLDFVATGNYGSGATFFWEFENGTPATSTDAAPQDVVFDSLGTSDVTVTVTEAVCSSQQVVSIEVFDRPQAYFHVEPLAGCSPVGVIFFDSSYAATPHQSYWNFGDGSNDSGVRVLHAYTNTGVYDITLTVWTEEGCLDTSTFTVPNAVEVFPFPTASLSVDTDFQFIFEPHFEFSTSSTAYNCQLFTGDGAQYADSLTQCVFQHSYSDTGYFQAVAIFTDQNGCTNSDSLWVRVEPEVRFWIPNAFTPNDDRINDTWGPKAFGFDQYEIWVYDRWGKLMFHSIDPFEKWNGRFNNESNHEPVLGVYSYRILAHSVQNTWIKEFGSVAILR